MEGSNKKDYYCPLCAKKDRLEEHIMTHTGEKPWACGKCNQAFAVKDYLDRHVRRVHQQQKKLHKCSLCSYATRWRSVLEVHTSTHTGERVYSCKQPNCDYAAKSSPQLKKHNIYKHTSERKFGCPFPNCGYRGKTKTALSKHRNNVHNECRPFVCDFEGCSYRSKRIGTLKEHKLEVHHGGYKPFACSLCSHRTASKVRLRIHQLRHAKENSVKCHFNGCTYSCKLQKNLQSHVMYCHTEKTLRCDFAGCTFSAAVQHILARHQKTVHHEKASKCSRCDYRTPFPSNTSQHATCPHKSKTFKSRSRDKPLNACVKCKKANLGCPLEACYYAASSKSALKRHMMQFHDRTGWRFQCPLCQKRFPVNADLSKHLRRHTREKPFKCPACDFEVASKDKFTRHMLAVHSRAFPNFVFDEEAICNHCNINFGCAVGVAMHTLTLKTAVVVLTRLQLKYDP